MAKKRLFIWLLVLTTSFAQLDAARRDSSYLQLADMPDASFYLPMPPDSASLRFVDDWHQYIWGKSVRPTLRGDLARRDAEFGISYLCKMFSVPMGIEISEKNTPELYKLLLWSTRSTEMATWKAKDKYMRKRPYMQFSEGTLVPQDEEVLRSNGSYPSGHTNLGWSAALILAELNPSRQDLILQRGYQYGDSRVIAGFHYQSDVDAGRLTASAGVARLHADKAFNEQMEKARRELSAHGIVSRETKGNLTTFDYPNGAAFLPAPPDTMSMRFYGDWAAYCQGRALRSTPRGTLAKADAEWRAPIILQHMMDSCGVAIDQQRVPQLLVLLENLGTHLSKANKLTKKQYPRKRPYAQMHESSLLPEEESTHDALGSYPSSHAATGWGLALVMAEIAPHCQDIILKRGYQYGESRIIAGYHWHTDVEAARCLAAATVARLHADPLFRQQLDKAKKEFEKL